MVVQGAWSADRGCGKSWWKRELLPVCCERWFSFASSLSEPSFYKCTRCFLGPGAQVWCLEQLIAQSSEDGCAKEGV